MNYLGPLIKLIVYVKADKTLPKTTREKASKLCNELYQLLFPYSD